MRYQATKKRLVIICEENKNDDKSNSYHLPSDYVLAYMLCIPEETRTFNPFACQASRGLEVGSPSPEAQECLTGCAIPPPTGHQRLQDNGKQD